MLDYTKPMRWKSDHVAIEYHGKRRGEDWHVVSWEDTSNALRLANCCDSAYLEKHVENVPERVERWVNIYKLVCSAGRSKPWGSRAEADAYAIADRLAVQKLVFEAERLVIEECVIYPVEGKHGTY